MPIRVLHVIAGMGSGGAENMIMNWYRNINRDLVQFDFLLRSKENIYADEIESLGGKIYYTSEYPKQYFRNKKETIQFFKQHALEYSAIHVHCNALLYVNVFDIAKKYGIKTRIIHSHSTNTKNKLFELLHKLNREKIHKKATHFFACSREAGQWAFKRKIEYKIIENGINVEKFRDNFDLGQIVKRDIGIEGKFVLGHVGRFLDVKNHAFLLDVFEKVSKKREDAVLVLVGTGPLENIIKKEVHKRGLTDKVYFLGVRKDVEYIYSAMDVFVFPSKYEGLALALIEAQSNGLYALASNRIPKRCKISKNIKFLPITDSTIWMEEILKTQKNFNRKDCWKEVLASGFNITASTKTLQDCYTGEKND